MRIPICTSSFISVGLTLSPAQSELPLAYTVYNNTVIGTLAVDGLVVTFGTASRGLGGLRLPLAATLPTSYNGIITIAGYKGLSNRY